MQEVSVSSQETSVITSGNMIDTAERKQQWSKNSVASFDSIETM